MRNKRGPGRPPAYPEPPHTGTQIDNYNSQTNYKNLSLFPAAGEENSSIDNGGNGGDGRGKKNKSSEECICPTCRDSRLTIEDQIKSLQKSVCSTKRDTNQILTEI